jgi:hypothetical protein
MLELANDVYCKCVKSQFVCSHKYKVVHIEILQVNLLYTLLLTSRILFRNLLKTLIMNLTWSIFVHSRNILD